jgi:hypothetical protein
MRRGRSIIAATGAIALRDGRQAQYRSCPVLEEQLESASRDLLRSMLSTFVQALMSADADAVCGAPYGSSSPDRPTAYRPQRVRDSWTWELEFGAGDRYRLEDAGPGLSTRQKPAE